jgi:hypothetical protein
MSINIFLSVGLPFSSPQELFVSRLEAYLSENGLRARTVGRNEFTYKKPLQLVDELMDRCAGVLVIALERITIERGLERRGSPQQEVVSEVAVPTPWNQIEAALAYSKRIPLFVIKERAVRSEGLLERGYDWYVHSTDVDPEFLKAREFIGTFESWRRDVKRRAGLFRYRR